MSFRMLRGNPLNPLHFPPNFLKMALACQNALRQTACPVPPDVVYTFVLSLGRVYHSRVKALHNFRFGEKRDPIFSRSVLRSAKILMQKCAILRNAARIGFPETPSVRNGAQAGENVLG